MKSTRRYKRINNVCVCVHLCSLAHPRPLAISGEAVHSPHTYTKLSRRQLEILSTDMEAEMMHAVSADEPISMSRGTLRDIIESALASAIQQTLESAANTATAVGDATAALCSRRRTTGAGGRNDEIDGEHEDRRSAVN